MKQWKQIISAIVFVAFLIVGAGAFILLPKAAISAHEKRVLSAFPKPELSAIADGSYGRQLETYLSDHFPARQFWVGVHSYMQLLAGGNGLSGVYLVENGRLIAAPEKLNETQLALNLSRFQKFAEKTGLPAAIMPVPSAGYVLGDMLPKNHQAYWDDQLFEILQRQVGALKLIDLRQEFLGTDQRKDFYYRTDHHLTSAGSYAMYEVYCAQQNLEKESFACTETYGEFYGTGYSRSGLWLTKPDVLEIWITQNPGQYEVTIIEGAKSEIYDSLYFREHKESLDKYPVFLDGNHSLVTIQNTQVQNGKRLLLIKDSYAHCFATFAAENYEQICMVDLRYYRGDVQELIAQQGLNEILYLYGVENLAASTDTAWLK